ncbi:MAG: hypothetical protein II046_06460, partial [Clostridiales bacterium]|nr:hypothetical protein [Clostridiales bacterium]
SSAIFRIITTEGELRDLPQISAIRSKIAALNAKIKGIMQSFISSSRYADVLESTVPVLYSLCISLICNMSKFYHAHNEHSLQNL